MLDENTKIKKINTEKNFSLLFCLRMNLNEHRNKGISIKHEIGYSIFER